MLPSKFDEHIGPTQGEVLCWKEGALLELQPAKQLQQATRFASFLPPSLRNPMLWCNMKRAVPRVHPGLTYGVRVILLYAAVIIRLI
jgi:hypothetical protein